MFAFADYIDQFFGCQVEFLIEYWPSLFFEHSGCIRLALGPYHSLKIFSLPPLTHIPRELGLPKPRRPVPYYTPAARFLPSHEHNKQTTAKCRSGDAACY